ncbi:Formate hydrogenlyase transcriptional activator [Fibrisoma limi BUZ 3]|uniref:Formate hydrogenlyase transcriptional activator n=1 Tax=Fibrisoma limi BUZ 3 TaxID=1185876 RepID=I2GLR5_9BACT|nr:sigma 54-interacting transcriptional regulator [Fibrisoma limi]CCH54841.1 Formate hydrogenlyase transcriptional activator [Fibrisoma limi BUZ 3]
MLNNHPRTLEAMVAMKEQVLSPSLLIVEDEFMIANDLRWMLEKAGYRVIGQAESVSEAMTAINDQQPDIVLLDIFLDGDQTGIDLAYWLRERDIPFVYLSANLTDNVLSEAKQTQPFGFLNKPFREKDVLTTLEIARFRHAHGEEAKLRQQKALQIAVNNAIVTIQDRERLCWAIADQINTLVPFSFFNLRIVRPQEATGYWLMLRRTSSTTFERLNLTSLLQRELLPEEIDKLEQESVEQMTEPAGIYTGLCLERLCERYQTVRSCYDYLGVRSLALFPIQLNQNSFTYLVLANTHADSFTQKEYEVVSLIIPQISLALNNLLAYEEIDEHRLIKTTELAIVTAFKNGKDIKETMLQVARALDKLLPFNLLIFGQTEEMTSELEIAVQKKGGSFEVVIDSSLVKWAAAQTVINGEQVLSTTGPLPNPFRENQAVRSCLHVPVFIKGQSTAWLWLYSQAAYAYTSKDRDVLQGISQQFAMALENMLAFIQIQKLSERLEQEKTYLTEELNTIANFEEMVGNGPAMQAVFKRISQVAPTDSTVLILGETGTGKELIARAVHNLSNRKMRTMVKVNCAALPAQLIESELFGHERGSFTGATEKRIGKFELADGGTIFLDEIGELPLELQSKLLRVIQEKEIERLGGKGPIKVNVRIIAATNRNLEKEVAANQFRPDLYFRLNVFPIELPPLRERTEDLLPLSLNFIQKISKKLGKPLTRIATSTLQKMRNYGWPGNIRELEHVLERAAILSETTTLEITEPLHSVFGMATPMSPSPPLVGPLQETMRAAILAALAQSGNRIRGEGGAAELLKIKPTTLEAKMKKLGINPRP